MSATPELAKALLAFHQEAPGLVMDSTNPHFRNAYASLDGIMAKVRPVLNKHGLVLTQLPTTVTDAVSGLQPALTTRLTHADSGEFVEATMPLMLEKQNSQGLGSALTYARRYSITALLALVGDEDEDGHVASAAPAAEPATKNSPKPSAKKISDAQRKRLFAIATEHNVPDDRVKAIVLQTGGVESTKDLTVERSDLVVEMLERQDQSF
jgi:hypothetical protein